ncbi:MAG: cytochrome c [Betaproteobacteria bacterium]|nr:cytochrome c [Betaproteobacteria bacterium]
MKPFRWITLLALIPSLAMAWPWSKDMANQISVKPQEGPDSVRQFPQRSVPMDGTKTTPYIHDHDSAIKLPNPNPATPESIARGKAMFKIYCVPCHGNSGTGDGLVGAKLIVRPFDLTADRVQKEMPEGYIFAHVTFGGALMPSYGNDMYPTERWDLVNYVRHGLKAEQSAAVGAK